MLLGTEAELAELAALSNPSAQKGAKIFVFVHSLSRTGASYLLQCNRL